MKTPEEEMQHLRAELAEMDDKVTALANNCILVDFLKSIAHHFDETFDDAVGAMRALSFNLHHLVQSPQGQAALTLLFIQRAGVDLPPMVRRIH